MVITGWPPSRLTAMLMLRLTCACATVCKDKTITPANMVFKIVFFMIVYVCTQVKRKAKIRV